MIKRLAWFIFLVIYFSSAAAQPPLRVAIAEFIPPFSMQAGDQHIFGFDIEMMRSICKSIERECQFKSMPFGEIIPALVNNEADIGVSGIAITLERSKLVNFSRPYLPSNALFLSSLRGADENFTIELLANKRIGVQRDTVFETEILQKNIKNPEIVPYRFQDYMIEALSLGEIDAILLDEASARYWAIHSAGLVQIVGEPMPFAYGMGIAINPRDPALTPLINQALTRYINSPAMRKNYETYFGKQQPQI